MASLKLTPTEIRMVLTMKQFGFKPQEIAHKFKVNRSTIDRYLRTFYLQN